MAAEALQVIVDLRADAETEAELEQLREKANEGTLSAMEEVSYGEIIDAVDLISIIQSKARRRLTRR